MSKAMELRIEEFNNWVAERIAVLETCYENQKAPLDYRLTRKEPVHKGFIEDCFKSAYTFINEKITIAKFLAQEAGIPEEVLDTAVKALKKHKSKVRREKAEYKKAFKELQESINQSVEDEAYIQKNETLVADIVNAWCATHTLHDYMKKQFKGEKLQKQIHSITINILTSRLHPNENELKEMVERQMKYYTAA